MKPLARTDRLIKQVVDQDTLVYDPADASACCLNSLASRVWGYCDGQHSVEDIARLIASEVVLPFGVEPEDAVWEVLDELVAHDLLAERDAFSKWTRTAKRRDVVKLLAALPLFPAIQALTAPISKSVTSGTPAPTPTPSSSSGGVPTPVPTATPGASPTPTPTPTMSATPTPTPTPSKAVVPISGVGGL